MNDFLHDAWKYYEYGRLYNNNLVPNQYVMVNTNQEFFISNQWIHMPDNEAMRRLANYDFPQGRFCCLAKRVVEPSLCPLLERENVRCGGERPQSLRDTKQERRTLPARRDALPEGEPSACGRGKRLGSTYGGAGWPSGQTERVIRKGEKMTSKYGIEIPEGSHYTVYKLTGPDGKVYIGYTGKGVEKRWRNGNGYSRRTPIRRAIDAFGWDAFEKRSSATT